MSGHEVRRRFLGWLLIGALWAGMVGVGAADPAPPSEEPRGSQMAGKGFRISTGPARDVGHRVAYNATDTEYLVVWADWRDYLGARGIDLYGRRIDADGTRLGPAFRISRAEDIYDDESAAVVWNAARSEYLVVWVRAADIWDPGRIEEVYGRRIKGDGTFTGPAFQISGPIDFGGVYQPTVAWNSVHDQYLVVWQDYRDGEDFIYGRRIDGSGVFLGAEFRIGGAKANDTAGPVVAFNATNTEYLVLWEDSRNYATRGLDLYARRVDADGTRLGNDFRVSSAKAEENEWGASVEWNAALNQYLVVWCDERDAWYRGTDIYGVRLKGADGTRLGGDVRLVGPGDVGDDFVGGLAWNATTGRYLLTLSTSDGGWKYGWDVFGQRLSAEGKRQGKAFRIIPPKGSPEADLTDDRGGQLAWDGANNRYLVVWVDYRLESQNVNLDVWGRLVVG
ncbi:MAG: hypothetical protein JW785_12030 [Acidimicrobiia bacterium]|nr:hypothetical protein [Acidimicrobiia bacterium]